jgi:hypothetical protein
MLTAEKVLARYEEQYFDVDVRHFQKSCGRSTRFDQLQLGETKFCGVLAWSADRNPADRAGDGVTGRPLAYAAAH